MAAAIERAIPETRIYSPIGLVQQFDRSITSELDFTIEADNAERFAENFEGTRERALPEGLQAGLEQARAHARVLRRQEGRRGRRRGRAAGQSIAKRAVGIIIKMIFEDGFFHADPHPGNIIILRHARGAGHRPHRPRHGRPALARSCAIARST